MSSETETLLPPNKPEAFESLCLDLWKVIWNDPGAQKNGRKGQSQAGVDVFGQEMGRWAGVQCKQKDGLLWRHLTPKELEDEAASAQSFQPPLTSFVVATSGPASVEVQEEARLITVHNQARGIFTVEVWSWEKIWHELYGRRELLKQLLPIYWPNLMRSADSAIGETIREAKDMIRRYRICAAAKGSDNVPESDRVRSSESTAWYAGSEGIIEAEFGTSSPELKEWREFADKVWDYMEEALNRDWGVYEGYINHLHRCIGLLTRFEARAVSRGRKVPSDDSGDDAAQSQLLSQQIAALKTAHEYQRSKDIRESRPIFVWRGGSQTKEQIICEFQNIGGRIKVERFTCTVPANMNVVPQPWIDRNQLGSVGFSRLTGKEESFDFEIAYLTALEIEETKRFSLSVKDGTPREH